MTNLNDRVTYPSKNVENYDDLFKAAEPTISKFLGNWHRLGHPPRKAEDIRFHVMEFEDFYNHSNALGAFAQLPKVHYCTCSDTFNFHKVCYIVLALWTE
jgi:hypothetical protein